MIEAVLLDLSGVLYIDDTVLPGALDSIEKLNKAGIPIRYVTNTTRSPRKAVVAKLHNMGFDVVAEDIFTAPIATHTYLSTRKLSPFLLVHVDLKQEFADLISEELNAVVIGDAVQDFAYDNMNQAFRLLMAGAPLIAMGKNKYFREADELSLDMGPFVTALEFAANTQSMIIGKPAKAFFATAVSSLGCQAGNVVMVGDDVQADVVGGLNAGLQGILVKTGKYQADDEEQLQGRGMCVDEISAAVDWILKQVN